MSVRRGRWCHAAAVAAGALSRNCDAPFWGRVRSTVLRRNERQPSEEGRFGRPRPPGLLLRRRGGFCERTNDRLEARAFAASRRGRGAWRAAAGALCAFLE